MGNLNDVYMSIIRQSMQDSVRKIGWNISDDTMFRAANGTVVVPGELYEDQDGMQMFCEYVQALPGEKYGDFLGDSREQPCILAYTDSVSGVMSYSREHFEKAKSLTPAEGFRNGWFRQFHGLMMPKIAERQERFLEKNPREYQFGRWMAYNTMWRRVGNYRMGYGSGYLPFYQKPNPCFPAQTLIVAFEFIGKSLSWVSISTMDAAEYGRALPEQTPQGFMRVLGGVEYSLLEHDINRNDLMGFRGIVKPNATTAVMVI